LDRSTTYPSDGSWGTTGANALKSDPRQNRGATSYYTHKLTLRPSIQIVEGLALRMQFDALEGVMADTTWKGNGATAAGQTNTSSRNNYGAPGTLTQENIEFEQCYVDFKTGIGQFNAGWKYGTPEFFGTTFLQQPYTRTRISLANTLGPLTLEASIVKVNEYRNRSFYGGAVPAGYGAATQVAPATSATVTAVPGSNAAGYGSNGVANDSDGDLYNILGIFKFNGGDAGLSYQYWRDAGSKALNAANANGALLQLSRINPYVKYKIGPLYFEAEGFYTFGNLAKYETAVAGRPDVTVNALGAYVMAQVDFKPFFVGAKFIYKSGNDQKNADKSTGSVAGLYGDDYGTPAAGTLILFNSDYIDNMGSNYGNAGTYASTRYIDNIWFYQAFAGINPTAKLNITAKVAYATADAKPRQVTGQPISAANLEFVGDKYGWEVDLTATYKIYDNLSYMVGGGYLFVGDYFKGFDGTTALRDNYMVTNKLMLSF
jgi:hypothetical protein